MSDHTFPTGKKCKDCKTAVLVRINGGCQTTYCEKNCGGSYNKICFHTNLSKSISRDVVTCGDCGYWWVGIREAEAQGYDHSKVPHAAEVWAASKKEELTQEEFRERVVGTFPLLCKDCEDQPQEIEEYCQACWKQYHEKPPTNPIYIS
jgi:hypothetical protein